jgi:CHAT domain-containing protein
MKKYKYISAFIAIIFCLTVSAHAYGNRRMSPFKADFQKASDLFEKKKFAEAGKLFEKMRANLDREEEAEICLEAAFKLAECHKALGYHKRALATLEEAEPLLKKSADRYRNAVFLTSLADLNLTLGGEMEGNLKRLLSALEEARKAGAPRLMAGILNELGNARAWRKEYDKALASYDKSLELLAGDQSKYGINLRFKAMLNKSRVLCLNGEAKKAFASLHRVFSGLKKTPDSHGKVGHLLALHGVIGELRGSGLGAADKSNFFSLADQTLSQALKIGEKIQNAKLLSSVYGHSGRLREEESRHDKGKMDEAKELTRKAIFFAGQGNFPEILYLWQWQMGRLFAAEKNIEKAIFFYKKAIETLNPIRGALFSGYRDRKDFFNLRVKPVYAGLAKLYLKQAEKAPDESVSRDKMFAARDAMEILKTAELQDFFKSECVVKTRENHERAHRAPDGVLLLYPMALEDGIVLLATFPDGIKQKKTDVSQKEVERVVRKLRAGLQNRTDRMFIYEAQKLYDWLIRPFEAELEHYNIDTLAIAPDGALRLIPFSTLHDGEKFLVEKYAMSVIPAISLTSFEKFDWPENPEILITGLSEARQGFPPLPGVSEELKEVSRIMNAKTFYSGKEHNLKNLKNEFKNKAYSIVHFATHGIFGSSPEKTFLLLYDGKLNMNGLSDLIGMGKFRKKQVELLTLSACQTALGDERAALGLAGVAVKAGVKSVLATLWFVDDEAASIVIREFYRQLKKTGVSKAKALAKAQRTLMTKKRWRHPAYWAPFLLIGNWM